MKLKDYLGIILSLIGLVLGLLSLATYVIGYLGFDLGGLYVKYSNYYKIAALILGGIGLGYSIYIFFKGQKWKAVIGIIINPIFLFLFLYLLIINGSRINTFLERNLSDFREVGKMSKSVYSPPAVLLKDGRVLVVGGKDILEDGNQIKYKDKKNKGIVEIFDPETESFARIHNSRYPYSYSIRDFAVLVSDFEVVFVRPKHIEIYNINEGAGVESYEKDSLNKRSIVAMKLSSDKILIAGGDRCGDSTPDGELYERIFKEIGKLENKEPEIVKLDLIKGGIIDQGNKMLLKDKNKVREVVDQGFSNYTTKSRNRLEGILKGVLTKGHTEIFNIKERKIEKIKPYPYLLISPYGFKDKEDIYFTDILLVKGKPRIFLKFDEEEYKLKKLFTIDWDRDLSGEIYVGDEKVLFIGGAYGVVGRPLKEVLEMNIYKRTVERIGDMKISRERPDVLLLPDGKVLIYGGRGTAPNFLKWKTLRTAEVFDPKTAKSVLLHSRYRRGASLTLLKNGNVLITGQGSGYKNIPAEIFEYDKWKKKQEKLKSGGFLYKAKYKFRKFLQAIVFRDSKDFLL